MQQLLDALTLRSGGAASELRRAGDERWTDIIAKKIQLSQQVKKLDLRAREYLNAEARKTIPPNVNVHARESAYHRIGTDRENRVNNEQTRVLPYAEESQSVACAPNNDLKILHGKKISASENEMNCRDRQLSNVYSASAASARPPEFRSYRQPNRLATAVAPLNVFVREIPKTVSGNKFALIDCPPFALL